jgi:hypothetical protein
MDIENSFYHGINGDCCRKAMDAAINCVCMVSEKSVCKGSEFLRKNN